MVFVFLYLPSLGLRISRSNRVAANASISLFFFLWLVFHCVCVYLLRLWFGATFLGAGHLYPLCSLQRLQERVLPASSSFWGCQVALGWWPPSSRFCILLHVASPLGLFLLCLLGGHSPWMEGPPHPGGPGPWHTAPKP